MRRALPVCVPLLLLALASGARAAAPGAGTVTVVAPDGSSRTVELASLTPDVNATAYTLRTADGTTRTQAVSGGFSLSALLGAAGLAPRGAWYAQVPRSDGGTTVLPGGQAGESPDGPPVVYRDGQGLHLLRPSTGQDDFNAADLVTVADGPLTIDLHEGEPFALQVHASTLRARVGQPVRFTAVVTTGNPAGVTFSWYFDEGRYVTGRQATHRFTTPGSYVVDLNATGGGPATAGVGATATVVVGAAPRRRAQRPASPRGSAGTGTAVTGGTGAGGGGKSAPRGAAGGGSATPRRAPHAAALRPLPPEQTIPTPQGDLVSGTLLAADAAPLPAAAALASASARPRDAGATPDGPLHVPAAAWAAAGLAALVALGWALESRHVPPFWQP